MTYLVVWRGDEDQFFQSEVDIGVADPLQMTNGAWVVQAAISEGYSEEDATALIEGSYELILVCDFPSNFYGSSA